ncbi:MAG: biotin--[acetyl-CoA-carboxylase] ligase [Syntrophaceae bacterium]|nr:biotin--[acetyl-CoA-carboxylase] ligase [Syntrophaceae bacterium]
MESSARQHMLSRLKKAGGGWVSGEELSRELRISRTAVWKHVCSLRSEGYVIESSTRKGYLLRESLDRLVPSEIEASLRTARLGRRIVCEREVDSTNRLARDLAIAGAAEGTVVIAESQTAGRGRMGRSWFSPAGEGIYLSLLLRPRFQPAEAPKTTLLAGVALAEALIPIVPGRVSIKWPNDVLAGGKKVAGILVEAAAEIDAIDYLIIGVGINVNTPRRRFPPELRERATSLAAEAVRPVSRAEVLADFLGRFESHYDRAAREGFGPVIRRWRELSDMAGRRVRVRSFDRCLEGIISGIGDDGALVLTGADGTVEHVIAGDVEYIQEAKG